MGASACAVSAPLVLWSALIHGPLGGVVEVVLGLCALRVLLGKVNAVCASTDRKPLWCCLPRLEGVLVGKRLHNQSPPSRG
eukprot:4864418-Amphidinium_carterae.1